MTTKGNEAAETVRQEPIASLTTPAANGDSRAPNSRASFSGPATPGSSPLPSRGSAPSPVSPSASNAPDFTSPGDIFFDFDQYAIRRDAQPVLERNASWIKNESGKSFLIEGHCDERGTLAYNLVLGEKRAKAAKRYLEDLGVPAARLLTTSYGEVKPFCKEHNEGCWKYNRRAHFVIQ
ncbi:MAG: OmpA family protein [Nitrospira sp.]|nr:OmpA family protein [Nitrospira sp.]